MKITTKEVREVTAIIEDIIAEYKEESEPKKRDWMAAGTKKTR